MSDTKPDTVSPLSVHAETTSDERATSPSPIVEDSTPSKKEEAPPTKPLRTMSLHAQAEQTLIEAFPSIDAKVVRAVLSASGGQIDPAFNALLGMSDPDFKEEAPPPQPPRPTAAQRQLDQDEMYARQLAQHYQTSSYDSPAQRAPPLPRRNQQGRPPVSDEERDHSFFDDDLPVITENVKKGFFETQKNVTKWITDFRKRIEGDDDDPLNGPPRSDSLPQNRRQNFGPSQSEQMYGIRKSAERPRKSMEAQHYDSDPRVLDDDFTTLEMRDDEEDLYKQRTCSTRPLSDPSLFKPTTTPPQSGPVDEVDAMDRKISRQKSPKAEGKAKWQPLTSIAPDPETEENDPFSLGDSDDDKEAKSKDLREADTARLKEAASNSVGEDAGGSAKVLEASETSGSSGQKNKEAEDLLAGKQPS